MGKGHDDIGTKLKTAPHVPTPYETLLHRVFFQTPAGKELLLKWREDIVNYMPVDINANPSDLQIGLGLGYLKLKQDIIRTIKRINEGGV
jgi:hypothetical protein